MSRRLYIVLSVLSLALFLAACVMWARGYGKQAAPVPTTAAMQASLGRTLPELRFEGVAFGDVIDFLRDVTGASIETDYGGVRVEGDPRLVPISFRLKDVPAGEAFATIAARLGMGITADANLVRLAVLPPPQQPRRQHVALAAALAAGAILLVCLMIPKLRRSRTLRMVPMVVVALTLASIALLLIVWASGPTRRERVAGDFRWTLTSHHGTLRLGHTPADPAAPYREPHAGPAAAGPDVERVFDHGGFFLRRGGWPFQSWVVGVPLWPIVALSLLVLILSARTTARDARRRHRLRRGQCLACGYSLTGNTSGVCPECGITATAGVKA